MRTGTAPITIFLFGMSSPHLPAINKAAARTGTIRCMTRFGPANMDAKPKTGPRKHITVIKVTPVEAAPASRRICSPAGTFPPLRIALTDAAAQIRDAAAASRLESTVKYRRA